MTANECEIHAAIARLQADGGHPHWEGGLRERHRKHATVSRLRSCVLAMESLMHPLNRTHISRDTALNCGVTRVLERDPEAKSDAPDADARLDVDETDTGAVFRVGWLVQDVIRWACTRLWDSRPGSSEGTES